MRRRGKVWLCAFGLAYTLSSFVLLFIYETYFRNLVVGRFSDGQAFDTVQDHHHSPRRRKATVATSSHFGRQETALPPHNARVHTCTLHNESIRLPMAPDVIIAGAMKSGTSFFWDVLRKHPDFVPSRKFEAHFFDWQFAVPPRDLENHEFWEKFDGSATMRDEQMCAARKQYIEDNFDIEALLQSSRARLTFEKTPNYMFLPQIPRLISEICPWNPKIVLILRNPVDRAYSHFVMDSDKDSVNLSFEEYIQLELETMRQHGLTNVPELLGSKWAALDESQQHLFEVPRNNMTRKQADHANWMVYRQRHMRNYLQRGIYGIQLERWKEYFPLNQTLMVIDNDRLLKEPRKVMGEVLAFLGAPRQDYFANESIPVSADAEKGARARGSRVKGITNLLSVGGYAPMAKPTRRFLEMFYKPYNQQLADVLGDEWRGIWD